MKYLTNSEMASWRRCKRQWWLGHYRRLIKADDTNFNKPLGIGNRVHDALAAYYDPNARTPFADTLAATRARDLEAYPDKAEDVGKECDLADIMLEAYAEWLAETGADQALTVIETERARVARLEPGRDVFLLSKLDARVRHDEYGSRLALEHKTVSSLKQHLPELRMNTQCLTEHLVEFMAWLEAGEDAEAMTSRGVLFNMLLKSKHTARAAGPFHKRLHVTHSTTALRNHWRHVVSVADQIEVATARLDAGEDHHLVVDPSPTATCHWDCEFFRVCAGLDDDTDSDSQIAEHYVQGDPLARYRGLPGAENIPIPE